MLFKDLVFITGGPGTGKTTLVVNLIRAYLYFQFEKYKKHKHYNIVLSAPTGKASSKLGNSVEFNCKKNYENENFSKLDSLIPKNGITLHRLFGVSSKRQKENILDLDLLIIDEASMLDLEFMLLVFKNIKSTAKIVFLGDKDQLPSIEGGTIFQDLINSKNNKINKLKFNIAELIIKNRSNKEIEKLIEFISKINDKNDYKINKLNDFWVGKDIDIRLCLENKITFFDSELFDLDVLLKIIFDKFFIEPYKDIIINDVKDSKLNYINELFNLVKNFKILCATNIGYKSVDYINNMISKCLSERREYFVDCVPVMVTKNNYTNQLFNGDQGLIVKNFDGIDKYIFKINSEYKEFSLAQLNDVVENYAMSIHKSQGSEYDTVLLILPDKNLKVISKELIYTAVTRAKNNIFILSKKDIFYNALKKDIFRDSGFRNFVLK